MDYELEQQIVSELKRYVTDNLSLSKMSDEELAKSLIKAKSMLNENDYQKLLDVIRKEREKQGK